jgi:uncharacterized protein YuzE
MAYKLGRLSVEYDDASDVLYLSIGDPQQALTEEGPEGVLIRKDPKTAQAVGVTILAYDRHFRNLDDVSWLEKTALPSDVVHYLEERPKWFRF